MTMRKAGNIHGVVGAVMIAALGLWGALALAEGGEPPPEAKMRAGMAVSACKACHPGEKDRAKLADPGRCCDQNCQRCHEDMDKHHPVGQGVEQTDRVPLPLLKSDRVGCISCHDPFSSPTDTKCWKAQSLFSRWFQSQKNYKTYYLRMNNSDGKMCKTCH